MSIHILGIRHHGPGSARRVRSALEKIKPDIVLVEGPPDADGILEWVGHDDLKPPVAILVFQPDDPKKAVFYPFSEFSPEWQAILYARQNKIPVKFMDLPMAHQFELRHQPAADSSLNNSIVIPDPETLRRNPIAWLAAAAGFEEEENWWEHEFEYRQDEEQVFEAITEGMHALRTDLPLPYDREEQLREAWMRKTIRQAEKEMYTEIAVVCGAWHAPALTHMPKAKEDNELLKGLAKVKTAVSWVPWTYNRLSYTSGYGAGINSPGWYEHLWHHPTDDGTRWMARVARLFREEQKDISVAHVMEAVRLANALAALRRLPRAGLEELNEATLSVLCNGENILIKLIEKALIVSDKIGEVPIDVPRPPLQTDIEKLQKKLRLPQTADFKDYTLDLRKENDLERSIFLHRLELLGIKWGDRYDVSGKGTFKEQWRLQWDPSLSIDIIERGSWGNTVEEATNSYVKYRAEAATNLKEVCELLESAIPAELDAAVDLLIRQINNLAAATGDVMQLMTVLPNLVQISRYGNVRKTDAALVEGIINGMITRICISLPAACTSLAEDAATQLLELFYNMNDAILLLQQDELTTQWTQTLSYIAHNNNTAPVISGYATRLLSDHRQITGAELVKAFSYAMSTANPPAVAAAWLEGFLKGSGTLLLVDNDLWTVVNNWMNQLEQDTFTQLLPLLRRTFSGFSKPERRKLGEKAKNGVGAGPSAAAALDVQFDESRAEKGIPVVMKMLGLG
ncbi:DUF5682 family protein [Chitinophaga sancti]|uniref:DUF5682 family protein n=1 Tax=Chitinophaga sancti TaxID=1004 RepID=A0A1K1P4L7_9BACT|nr:DUF5682 family protein [Chitinophaga sancti]WQD60464.1 DUF5682 family protein [Chitinophaga sancti]WQG87408.1 DUF5682 family protein [Chitinophaga sancti]SFW42397.1 hypothetical protein SAMN05661012_01768 [Chitinophaga sancti]